MNSEVSYFDLSASGHLPITAKGHPLVACSDAIMEATLGEGRYNCHAVFPAMLIQQTPSQLLSGKNTTTAVPLWTDDDGAADGGGCVGGGDGTNNNSNSIHSDPSHCAHLCWGSQLLLRLMRQLDAKIAHGEPLRYVAQVQSMSDKKEGDALAPPVAYHQSEAASHPSHDGETTGGDKKEKKQQYHHRENDIETLFAPVCALDQQASQAACLTSLPRRNGGGSKKSTHSTTANNTTSVTTTCSNGIRRSLFPSARGALTQEQRPPSVREGFYATLRIERDHVVPHPDLAMSTASGQLVPEEVIVTATSTVFVSSLGALQCEKLIEQAIFMDPMASPSSAAPPRQSVAAATVAASFPGTKLLLAGCPSAALTDSDSSSPPPRRPSGMEMEEASSWADDHDLLVKTMSFLSSPPETQCPVALLLRHLNHSEHHRQQLVRDIDTSAVDIRSRDTELGFLRRDNTDLRSTLDAVSDDLCASLADRSALQCQLKEQKAIWASSEERLRAEVKRLREENKRSGCVNSLLPPRSPVPTAPPTIVTADGNPTTGDTCQPQPAHNNNGSRSRSSSSYSPPPSPMVDLDELVCNIRHAKDALISEVETLRSCTTASSADSSCSSSFTMCEMGTQTVTAITEALPVLKGLTQPRSKRL